MNRSVLIINWRDTKNPEAGGAEIYYHEIFRRLAAKGLAVTVLSHAFNGAPAEETVDAIRVIRRGPQLLFNYAIIPFLVRHAREYDLIVEDLNKIPFFTPLFLRQKRLHLVMHFFGAAIFREVFFPFAVYVFLAERLVRLVYRRERFVAISDSTRREIDAFSRGGLPTAIVEPGIDTEFYHPVCPKSAVPTLVCVTRLKRYKNVQFLIRALPLIRKELPETRLIIAGSGEYRATLDQQVRESGQTGSVVFEGFVSEERKRELLSQAWLFVIPSVKEGWGICNIEASLCATVPLASNVAGLRDSVHDGETGFLFEYNNLDDYVRKALTVLTNAGLRESMQERARSFGMGFSWDRMSERMGNAIESAIGD